LGEKAKRSLEDRRSEHLVGGASGKVDTAAFSRQVVAKIGSHAFIVNAGSSGARDVASGQAKEFRDNLSRNSAFLIESLVVGPLSFLDAHIIANFPTLTAQLAPFSPQFPTSSFSNHKCK
jgi:hypothetical protein